MHRAGERLMTAIKICGMTNRQDALCATKNGATFLGFIFAKGSPRYVTPDTAKSIVATGGAGFQPASVVAVLRNEPIESTIKIISQVKADFVQLHGSESPEYCAKMPIPVIKAIEITESMTADQLVEEVEKYRHSAKYLLFDRPKNLLMERWLDLATGLLKQHKNLPPYFFAGGLTAENVVTVVNLLNPFGVDVASSVEALPGKKDEAKVQNFCEAVVGKRETEAKRS
jgi:phosphoribosylanthranilate isomerase